MGSNTTINWFARCVVGDKVPGTVQEAAASTSGLSAEEQKALTARIAGTNGNKQAPSLAAATSADEANNTAGIESVNTQIAENKAQAEDYNKEKETLTKNSATLNEKATGLDTQIKNLSEESSKCQAGIDELNSQLSSATDENAKSAIKEKITALQTQKKTADDSLAKANEDKAANNKAIEENKQKISENTKKIEESKQTLAELTAKLNALNKAKEFESKPTQAGSKLNLDN